MSALTPFPVGASVLLALMLGCSKADPPKADIPATAPLQVERRHAPGQVYVLSLKRSMASMPDQVLELGGKATVTAASPSGGTFDLLLDKLTFAGQSRLGGGPAKLVVKVDDRTVNATPVGPAEGLALYLTVVEVMMGDLCRPPKEAKAPGATWKVSRGTSEESIAFKSLTRKGAKDFASFERSFEGKPDPNALGGGDLGGTKVFSLSVDDGFEGMCRATKKMAVGSEIETTTYDIAVDREK